MRARDQLLYGSLPVDLTKPIEIHHTDKGRFWLNPDNSVYDAKDEIIYAAPSGVPAGNIFWESIPGLAPDGVSLVALFTYAVKPLKAIDPSLVLGPNATVKVQMMGTSFKRQPTSFFWVTPETGVAHMPTGGTDLHVLGASDYVYNPITGAVKSLSKNETLVSTVAFNGKVFIDSDVGQRLEVTLGELAMFAKGQYTIANLDKDVIYRDDNVLNTAWGNLLIDPAIVNNGVSTTDKQKLQLL
jgi:hypothetical protein